MLYHDKEGNNYLIFSHDKEANLPIDGWFHNCLHCGSITGNEVDFKYNNHNLKILLCPNCNKFDKLKLYENKLNNYIKKNIPELRRNKFLCNII